MFRDPSGVEVQLAKFGFDSFARLNEVTAFPNDTRSSKVGIEFDEMSRRSKLKFANGLETTQTFDDVDRITSITTPGIGYSSYGFDRNGNINSIRSDRGEWSMGYDASNWLIQNYYKGTNQAAQDENIVWDGGGNRNGGRSIEGVSTKYFGGFLKRPLLFNNHLLEDAEATGDLYVAGKVSYRYDFKGNVIEKYDNVTNEHWKFFWDQENKLIKSSLNSKNVDNLYDGMGRRIFRSYYNVGWNSTISFVRRKYVYDRENVLYVYDFSNQPTSTYIGTGEIDNQLMKYDGKMHFIHTDHQGSVIATSNNVGQLESKYSYTSFGFPLDTGPALFGYTGREYDPEIRLHYYRHRYYDASTGRFMSRDPLGYGAGDANFYRYVNNSPYMGTDPSGLVYAGIALGGSASVGYVTGSSSYEYGTYLGYSDLTGVEVSEYSNETIGYGPNIGGGLGGAASLNLGWGDSPQGVSYSSEGTRNKPCK